MKKPTLKERFTYWFDNRMAKGSLSQIDLLAFATVISVFILTCILLIFRFNGDAHPFESAWDLLATVINAEFPYSDAGGIGLILITFLAAIVGLLFTSILIGIISSAIEEKVDALKSGSSAVLESGHTVVLGFIPGEYTLIEQLILSASGEKKCILVAGEQPQDEILQLIRENVEIPKNIKLITRTVNLTDPRSLEKCSLPTSHSIIISPTDDLSVIKQVLASAVIVDSSTSKTKIAALMSKKEAGFPESLLTKHNITTFNTGEVLAKIIAHSCSQTGLPEVFTEIFNFEGCELYAEKLQEAVGKTFGEIMLCVDRAVPVGLITNSGAKINPEPDTVINEEDKILLFTENRNCAVMSDTQKNEFLTEKPIINDPQKTKNIVIIGSNDALSTIISELPEQKLDVTLADFDKNFEESIKDVLGKRTDMFVKYNQKDLTEKNNLYNLVKNANHVILIGNHGEDDEAEDMKTIFYILNLRDLREKYNLKFTVTAEMTKDANKRLIYNSDDTDYIVSKNMMSLFLAQLAESPELYDVFWELLSNEGNEIYIKKAKNFGCYGEMTTAEIRDIVFRHKCIFMGYKKQTDEEITFNSGLTDTILLDPDDKIVVISEN